MTIDPTQKYAALIRSIRNYISQEHSRGSWITSDRETYDYFIQQATKSKSTNKKTPEVSVPTKLIPTAPLVQSPIIPTLPNVASKIQHSNSQPTPKNVADITLNHPTMTSKASDPLSEAPPSQSKPSPIAKIDPTPAAKAILNPKHFIRESPSPILETDFSQLRSFIKEKFPAIGLVDQIADDSGAKAIAQNWKAPEVEVLILSFSELPKERTFLENLAIAIGQTLASVKVISATKYEQEKGWDRLLKSDRLRLVIANNYSLHTFPELMKYYHEDNTGKHTLGPAELQLLSDLSLYMQEPSLKATLWKTLRSQLLS